LKSQRWPEFQEAAGIGRQ